MLTAIKFPVMLLFFLTITFPVFSQTNLVLNPSFIELNRCPINKTDVYAAKHWYQPNTLGSSTDLFCRCDPTFWIPYIYQQDQLRPRTGDCYVQFSMTIGWYEYICGRLSKPLEEDRCYNVQFYVTPYVHRLFPAGCTDRVGVWFSQDSILRYPPGFNTPMYLDAYVENRGGVIYDTTKWTRVRGSFIAKGGEKHFIIGNFYGLNNNNIKYVFCHDTLMPDSNNLGYWVGLLIDDISVWSCDAPVYEADAGQSGRVCYGDAFVIGNNIEDSEYGFLWSSVSHRTMHRAIWDTLSTNATLKVEPKQTTTYYLRVTDFKLDVTYDSVTVYVDPCMPLPKIPNVFTPNGDGINDYFEFKEHEGWELKTQIYNRWGKVVFIGINDDWWDGNIQGQPAAEGVYYYSVTAKNHFGQHETLQGSVSLLR